jgi:transposase
MLRIDFTPAEIAHLEYERYHHPHPRVQRKMEVLYLKAQGLRHHDIKRVVRISENTLLSYLRDYQEGGLEALKAIRFRRPESGLSAHHSTLEAYFRGHPPASANEAAAKIEELTGIKGSPNRVRVFMKKLGMRRRKVGTIPAKADADVQEQFKKEEIEPRIEEARAGKRTLFL